MVRIILEYLWKASVCALTYLVGTAIAGATITSLGLPLPQVPFEADKTSPVAGLVVGCILLALGLGPVAKRIGGGRAARGLMLAAFTYVCLGPNVAIEAAVFTKFGGLTSMALMPLLPCVLVGFLASALFRQAETTEPPVARVQCSVAGTGWQSWLWRIAAGVVSFLVIYFVFGMPVGVLVEDYYRQEASGLVLPGLSAVVCTQLLRGALYLAVCLPIVISWSGSRREFILVFGIAFFVITGLFGMSQATWLPVQIRLIHTVEFFVDAMAYASVLAVLFRMPGNYCREASDSISGSNKNCR